MGSSIFPELNEIVLLVKEVFEGAAPRNSAR